MRLVSLQAGPARTLHGEGRPWRTAIAKDRLEGPVRIAVGGLPGDAVADERHHGGPDQALLCFGAGHYPLVEARLGRRLGPGSFGENLTIAGLDEACVRIGDRYRVGSAEIEVTAPRTPCETLGRHLGDPGLVAALREPHRAGWYARVLREGDAREGDAVALLRPGDPDWTVRRAAAVKAARADLSGARGLLAVPALAARWQASLRARLWEGPS
jgi:MOSC domain-containing protein YiiM